MAAHFFETLHRETENRFWINNPSGDDIDLAIQHGAIACTTNPAYCSKLVDSNRAYLDQLVDDTVEQTPNENEAAGIVYQKASQRIMRAFLPHYEQSGGKEGFVTMQSDPRIDEDVVATIEDIDRNRTLAPNYMAKIPVIAPAFDMFRYCIAEDIPICATEVFALSQARAICELYERETEKTGNRPPIYVTHITGIFDEYLKKVVERRGIEVDHALLERAGLAVARKQYRMFAENGFNVPMLGGGARETYHFTGLIGGKIDITINWSTAKQLIDENTPVRNTINDETPRHEVDELRRKIPEFRKAYDEDGLVPGEFATYGPVQLFRNAFLKGWYQLLAYVATRKHARAL